jgi:hypothetical protein
MEAIEEIKLAEHERYIRNIMYIDITLEYTQERYTLYDYEEDCENFYMDNCNLWDDKYFHNLLDDSSPPIVENINVKNHEIVMITIF